MEISLEKIDLLRKRADVSYKEAKEALEKNDGDVVEALAYLEEANKIRPEKTVATTSFWEKVKRLYHKGNAIRIIITKDNTIILNFGLPLALLIILTTAPLTVALLIVAVLTGCKIRFVKNGSEEYSINQSIDLITSKANALVDKVAQEIKK